MSSRASRVVVDLSAIRHNVRQLVALAEPARTMVVVKANGYGHGATRVAEVALEAGAHGLCVALVQEGVELRRAGIEAPILVLSEQPREQLGELVAHGLIATVYSVSSIDAIADEARRRDVVGQEVHLKVDTGMNRVGARPDAAVELGGRVLARSPQLSLGGVFTHLACADDRDSPVTQQQVRRFDAVIEQLRRAGIDPGWLHIANSAGTLAHPDTRRDMVRVGIAAYGIAPDPSLDSICHSLRPALRLASRVSFVKRVAAGEAVSYGHRHRFDRDTTVATVPIGYADGVPRRLSAVGGEVLVGGRRRPIVGVVTMDQLMVDMGDDACAIDDEVVLIGSQGEQTITANDWGSALGTIGYEIVCGMSARLAREYLDQ
ncbi:MAG: alanine racemase [Actinomycetota bacterium]